MLKNSNIFVTGGAGTLGRAIARKRQEEGWTGRLTVYSTDDHKHALMRKTYPDVQYVQGDIRNFETLYNAMAGHDVVIHAAAVKVIPTSEFWSVDTYDVNVIGSLNVFQAAIRANVEHVLAISTDKACHPANAYGATKYMMEKAAQEYSRIEGMDTSFHLVRYGNVLESTGSVVEMWKSAIAEGQAIKITDPEMTRFWLSPRQAVEYVLRALKLRTGLVYIPMMPALSIGKLVEYVLEDVVDFSPSPYPSYPKAKIPLRPGEKMHETLLTLEELPRAVDFDFRDYDGYFTLRPSTEPTAPEDVRPEVPYSSDIARELTKDELTELLND